MTATWAKWYALGFAALTLLGIGLNGGVGWGWSLLFGALAFGFAALGECVTPAARMSWTARGFAGFGLRALAATAMYVAYTLPQHFLGHLTFWVTLMVMTLLAQLPLPNKKPR